MVLHCVHLCTLVAVYVGMKHSSSFSVRLLDLLLRGGLIHSKGLVRIRHPVELHVDCVPTGWESEQAHKVAVLEKQSNICVCVGQVCA
jgi:hypothetical protein